MHEYSLTGRPDTDECIKLANIAHNLYFEGPLKKKVEFLKASKHFFDRIYEKFIKKYKANNLKEAFNKLFVENQSKIEFLYSEFRGVKYRVEIALQNPELINEKNEFLLEHIARFIEIILSYACSVKEEVENHKKFNFNDVANNKISFFKINEKNQNRYLDTFLDCAFRSQKSLTGIRYIKTHLEGLNDPYISRIFDDEVISDFYHENGPDYLSAIMFARMANEQLVKYLTDKNNLYENNSDKNIHIPERTDLLLKKGIINRLQKNEILLINSRGNNIAHNGISSVYSSCYTAIQFLYYFYNEVVK